MDVGSGAASIEGANFRDASGGLDGFLLLAGPDRIHHRYSIENLRFGLAVVSALGRARNVATPFIDAMCTLADAVCDPEFSSAGWSLEDLGLGPVRQSDPQGGAGTRRPSSG